MFVDISNDDILMNDSLGFFLGVPQTQATGTLVVESTTSYIIDGPIYPVAGNGILPTEDDVTVYSKSSASPPVYTEIDLASTKPIDVDGDDNYNIVNIKTALSQGLAFAIDYVEEIQPFIAQDITATVKTAEKEVGRMYSTDTMTGYGNVSIDIKSEQIMGKSSLEYIRKLMFKDSDVTGATGYNVYDMRKKPLNVYAYSPMVYEDEILGRLYYEAVTIEPDLPGGKQGDTLGFTINCKVAKQPRLVIPTASV